MKVKDETKKQVAFIMDAAEYMKFKKLAIDKRISVKDYLISLIRRELEINSEEKAK